MKISILCSGAGGAAVCVMKSRADHAVLFAHPNNLLDGAGASRQGQIDGGVHVTAARLVGLRPECGKVFLVHRRHPRQLLSLGDRHLERGVLQIAGVGRTALFVNPNGHGGKSRLAAAVGGK